MVTKRSGGIASIQPWISDTSEGESGVNPAVRLAKKSLIHSHSSVTEVTTTEYNYPTNRIEQ